MRSGISWREPSCGSTSAALALTLRRSVLPFGAAPMLSAKIWLIFAASGAGVVLAGCPPPGQPRNTYNFCDHGVLFSHLRREVAEVTILYKQPEHTGALP